MKKLIALTILSAATILYFKPEWFAKNPPPQMGTPAATQTTEEISRQNAKDRVEKSKTQENSLKITPLGKSKPLKTSSL